jgi:fibro-slime domain-containing protein
VWIYVNNILAIDLGGLNDTAKGSMQLDKRKTDLKLVNGETYNLDIFFAERNTIGSNLLIRTSMDLRNSGELYYKEKPVGPGTYEYTIWEQKQSEGNDCGLTRLTDGEQESKVDFYIEGPQFPEGPKQIPAGVHYNGITVDPSGSRVTIDSAKISGLKSGDYRITFISVFNKDRSGYLTFSVAPIPDHLDIMPDSMKLDLKNDAVFDFINLGIEQDSLLFYTVIRDIYGTYLENGNNLTWTSRDEKVVTIEASLTDMSKALVTKVGEGNTWIIVRTNGLKAGGDRVRRRRRR